MQWHKKPILQLFVMTGAMIMIVSLQNGLAHNVFNVWTGGTYSKVSMKQKTIKEKTEIVKVQAATTPSCPDNSSAIEYAWTEDNTAIAPPKRMRYVDEPWEYDSLNTTYFSRTSVATSPEYGNLEQNTTFREDGGPNDDGTDPSRGKGIPNILSSIFQYKPAKLRDAYVLKYASAPRGNDTQHKGSAPAIEVPSKAGFPICVPSTGYDVGGGYEAMIVSVDGDRVTLHIGIHEYMDGDNADLGGCPSGKGNCRGGYWIYLSGINVDSQVSGAYDTKRNTHRSSTLPTDIKNRIQLPVIKPGRKLGTSKGDGVIVAIRDSGPFITINEPFMWGGYPDGSTYGIAEAASPTPTTVATTNDFDITGKVRVTESEGTYVFTNTMSVTNKGSKKTEAIVSTAWTDGLGKDHNEDTLWNRNANNTLTIKTSSKSVMNAGYYTEDINNVFKFTVTEKGVATAAVVNTINCGYRVTAEGIPSVSGPSNCICENCDDYGGRPATTPSPTRVPDTGSPPAESPSPGADPPIESTKPEVDLVGVDKQKMSIMISDGCNNTPCNMLKYFISQVRDIHFEGGYEPQLIWRESTDGQEKESSMSRFTYVEQVGAKGFTFIIDNNPDAFPDSYDLVSSLIFPIEQPNRTILNVTLKGQ